MVREMKEKAGSLSYMNGTGIKRLSIQEASDEQIQKALQLLKDKYGISQMTDSDRPSHKVDYYTRAPFLRDISTETPDNRGALDMISAVLPELSPGESALLSLYKDFKEAINDDESALLFRPSTSSTLTAEGSGDETTTTAYKPLVTLSDLVGLALPLIGDTNILDSYKEKIKTLNEHKKRHQEMDALRMQLLDIQEERNIHIRDFAKKYLEDAGVTFDTLDISEYREVADAGFTDKSQSGQIVKKSWDYMPKELLLAIKGRMLATRRRITFQRSATRGHYKDRTTTVKFDNVSTALHEQGHMVEEIVPTITYLEHAFLSKRIKEKLQRDRKLELQNSNYIADGSMQEVSLSDVGVTSAYTAKFYPVYSRVNPMGGEYAFGPSKYFEVFTTGLEDLFTNPGRYSNAGTQTVVIGKGSSAEYVSSAYRDPSTGFWYRDISKSERIYPTKVQGRGYSDGQDKELKGFILGTIMMLHDWK